MSMRRDTYWSAAETIVSSGLAFLLRLVVARVLAPEDFGVAAIAVTVVTLLQTVNDFGLTAALIQRDEKDVTRDFIDTTFTASLLITFLLAAIVGFLVAPLAASAYGEPQLFPLILALSVTLLPVAVHHGRGLASHAPATVSQGGDHPGQRNRGGHDGRDRHAVHRTECLGNRRSGHDDRPGLGGSDASFAIRIATACGWGRRT